MKARKAAYDEYVARYGDFGLHDAINYISDVARGHVDLDTTRWDACLATIEATFDLIKAFNESVDGFGYFHDIFNERESLLREIEELKVKLEIACNDGISPDRLDIRLRYLVADYGEQDS